MEVRFSAYKGVDGMGPLYTPFETIIAESDVITLHCPLTPATRNLIGPAEFAAMKKRPLIVNTARGGLVDEAALAGALRAGRIAGAGFDVVPPAPTIGRASLRDRVGQYVLLSVAAVSLKKKTH